MVLDTMKLRLPSLPRLDRPLLCAVMARVSDKVLGKSWSVAGLLRARSPCEHSVRQVQHEGRKAMMHEHLRKDTPSLNTSPNAFTRPRGSLSRSQGRERSVCFEGA